jgi:hypothetical protein
MHPLGRKAPVPASAERMGRTARHSAPPGRRPNIQRLHSEPGWRNHGACPNLPAADRPTPPTNAGTSILVTSTPTRSRSAAAFPSTRILGDGLAASIPASHPGEHQNGTGPTFERARADFEDGWTVFLSNRTEADFQAWRDERDWTARKYAMWERGEKMPTQKPSSLMRCPCGETFDSHRPEHTMIHVPHISAAEKARAG